jgi:hypothetical protein
LKFRERNTVLERLAGHCGGTASGHRQLTSDKCVVAVECYSGIVHERLLPKLQELLQPARVTCTETDLFKSPEQIDALVAPWLGGEDPIFGFMTRLEMVDFLNKDAVQDLRNQLAAASQGLHLVYGPGASLCCEPDLLIYADMPRWEGQLRQRRDEVDNLGVRNRGLKASLQYKRSFFIDWRVCDKLKVATMQHWDYLLDTTVPDSPKLITGNTLREGLKTAATKPFRVVPFFDPGPWGGQWMKEVCDLPDGPTQLRLVF